MVIHDGVVMLILFWNVIYIHTLYTYIYIYTYIIYIYIYITCDYKPWAYPWRRWTTTSSLSHASASDWGAVVFGHIWPSVKSIECRHAGCCGDPWWTLGFGWGTLCSQCQVSCQRLRRYASAYRLQNGFPGHIPFVAYSCFFLSNASVSTSIIFAESQCMSYIYIYT